MQILQCVQTKLGNTVELIGSPGSNNILVIGVVHGDEPQGKFLIDSYLSRLSDNKICAKNNLLFIPCLNPDGMARKTRTNANGVDLNRNFPTANWGKNLGDNATCDDNATAYYGGECAASEIETQFLIDTVEKYSPKLVVTLHTPYKIVNYDGPAQDIAQRISDIIKYPVEKSVGYPTPGSFGTFCGAERGIPTITLEMDEICPVEELIPPIYKIFDYLYSLVK